jgi:hypothetical protein
VFFSWLVREKEMKAHLGWVHDLTVSQTGWGSFDKAFLKSQTYIYFFSAQHLLRCSTTGPLPFLQEGKAAGSVAIL